jgi:proteic killer suppression protein
MAIRNFKTTATADIAQGKNTKDARTIKQDAWKVARRKLDLLNGITSLADLQGEGNKLHAMKDKPGYHSLRVGDKYRIVFKFEDGHVEDVEITDYH